MPWLRRLVNALRSSRVERDIERELSFHLAERARRLRSEGASDAEALRRARVAFGSPAAHAERTRDTDVAAWADAVLRAFRHAARALWRTPGFTATGVVTLALGIGANASVFSALDAVVLEPLPVPAGDRLVRVRQVLEIETQIAPARLEDWSRSNATFEALSGYYVEDVADTTGDLPERVRRAVVAPRFLDVWGVGPALGRAPAEAGRRPAAPSLLISDRYWRRRLGADPDVLARLVRIEGQPFSIAGVMPPAFSFPDPGVELWWPYPTDEAPRANPAQARELRWYTGIGRLKRGVTPEQAGADLALVQARLGRQYPDTDADIGVRVVPYREAVVGGVRGWLWLVYAAVSLLLLTACTNIAALLLSRAAQRRHEVAIRFSLGASRAVVAGQLLAEAALVSFAGAAVGLLVAAGGTAAIRALAPDLPRLDEIGIDARMLAYTTAAAVLVALLCGALPALRGVRAASSLASPARTPVSAGQRVQWLLVAVQMALSVTLLAGAGLLLRSAAALARVDPGFDPARVLAFRVSGNWSETRDRERLVQRIGAALDELAALPGVASAATAWSLPGVPRRYPIEFALGEGRARSEAPLVAEWRTVSPGYFATLRIPLLAGEACHAPSDPHSTPEVMVNRSFATRYFRGRSVIGRHLAWEAGAETGRIVGIVADARELGMDQQPAPTVYACDSAPNPFPWFLVRTHGEPLALAGAVRLKLKALEPLRSVHDIAPLEDRISAAYAQGRLRTLLLTLFATTALGLACLGVFATLSHVVGLRRREIGLRLALGALPGQLVRQLVWRALRVVGPACLCGLALAAAATRALSGMLYGVTPSDPVTLAAVLGFALAVAFLAALVPAARAARVAPMRVLREE